MTCHPPLARFLQRGVSKRPWASFVADPREFTTAWFLADQQGLYLQLQWAQMYCVANSHMHVLETVLCCKLSYACIVLQIRIWSERFPRTRYCVRGCVGPRGCAGFTPSCCRRLKILFQLFRTEHTHTHTHTHTANSTFRRRTTLFNFLSPIFIFTIAITHLSTQGQYTL